MLTNDFKLARFAFDVTHKFEAVPREQKSSTVFPLLSREHSCSVLEEGVGGIKLTAENSS